MKNFLIISALIAAMSMSCQDDFSSDDIVEEEDIIRSEGYFISMEGINGENDEDAFSRNYWDESEDESLVFRWENSEGEMKSFVFDGSSVLEFVDGSIFSNIKVSADTDEPNVCSMNFVNGLATEFKDGYTVWSICPMEDGNIVSDTEVCLTIPEYFTFATGQKSPTEHLKEYLYMSGTGVVSDNKSVIDFDVLPSILRFRITNSDTETLIISKVGLTGPFNDKVVLEYSPSGVGKKYYSEGSPHSVAVYCHEGVEILPGESVLLYALVFPTELTDETVTMRIESNYGDREASAAYNSIFRNDGFESNACYTLGIPVSRLGIDLGNANVEDFMPGDTCTVNLDKIM